MDEIHSDGFEVVVDVLICCCYKSVGVRTSESQKVLDLQ